MRVSKKRPADWPHPDDVPGRYETPFGVLIVSDKGTSRFEAL